MAPIVRDSDSGRDPLLPEEWCDGEHGRRENTTSPKCFMVFHSFMTTEAFAKFDYETATPASGRSPVGDLRAIDCGSVSASYGPACAACTPLTLVPEAAVQLVLVAPVAPPAVLPFKFTK